MVLDSISSPLRRSQNPLFQSPSKKSANKEDLGDWPILLTRHRFLLSALALLTFLCVIYLYFAVTFSGGSAARCAAMTGAQKLQCQAKYSFSHNGKLRFL